MKSADIETKLANEISKEVPDVLDRILSKCELRSEKIIQISEHKKTINNLKWLKPACATAAMLALIVGGYFGISQHQKSTVESVITLDVNPSVELKINKNEKVVSAEGLNEDGITIIDRMKESGNKLKGAELDTAVIEIVNTMAESGFLNEKNSSVLVTVDNPNEEKSEELKSRLLINISNTLSENGIEGAIICQHSNGNEKTAKLAVKYGISESKAELIEKIVVENPNLSFEQLVELSISDLSMLAENSGSITIIGFNAKGYVSTEYAVDSACYHANVNSEGNAQVGVSVGVNEGKLVYNVSVKAENNEFNYKIDAKTGSILKWSTIPLNGSININSEVSGIIDKNQNSNSAGVNGQVSAGGQINGNTQSITPDNKNGNTTADESVIPKITADDIIDSVFDIIHKAKDKVIGSGITG